MRSFHFPGRSLVYGRRAMCAPRIPPPASPPSRSCARRQRRRCGDRHGRGAGGGRAADDGHRRRLLRADRQAGRKKLIALNAAGRAPKAATLSGIARRAKRHRDRPARTPSRCPAPSTAGAPARGSRHMPLERLLAAGHRACRGRLRRGPARRRRLGARRRASWRRHPAPGRHLLKGGEPPRPARSCASRRWRRR